MLVRYREFRRLHEQRTEANNSIMALLAGSKLAVNTLRLTTGSKLRLSEIFPEVPHIERFDLRTDRATHLLDNAEAALAVMAIPYILAIHEDYMCHCISLLIDAGVAPSASKMPSAKAMHAYFETAADRCLPSDLVEMFQVIRMMRNCHIHAGGLANQEMCDERTALGTSGESKWGKWTGKALPTFAVGDAVPIGQAEVIVGLALTSALAKESNEILGTTVPTTHWAKLAIADALADGVELRGNDQQRFRTLRGFVRLYYAGVGISDSDLEIAAKAAGLRVKA